MSPNDPRLQVALAHSLDIVVLTDDRGRELVAPVFKQILALRDHGVPEATVTALLDSLKACCQYNSTLSVKAQTISGILDALSRVEHGPQSIKGVARTLRPALKVLGNPHGYTAAEYVIAVRTVDDLAAVVPHTRLLSASMRHELRSRAFRTLSDQLSLPRAVVVGGVGATIPDVAHLEVAA